MFAVPAEPYEPSELEGRALNTLLILHADHEQNCSTSTVRLVGSSDASLYTAVSAGISALWGPLHGGANQAVMNMLREIKDSGGEVARDWQSMSHEHFGDFAYEETFFERLDQTLADTSPEATERLAIYYTCIGLGFTGFYQGQPEYLTRKMLEISSRLQDVAGGEGSRICDDAYKHTNRKPLEINVKSSIIGILIVFGVVLVTLFFGNVYLYWSKAKAMNRALATISEPTPAEEN